MKVYKTKYTKPIPKGKLPKGTKLTKDGKRILCESKLWIVPFEFGKMIFRVKAYTDEAASLKLSRLITKIIDQSDLTADDKDYIENMPSSIRDELIGIGLLKTKRDMSLPSLCTEFENWLRTSKHTHGFKRTKRNCDTVLSRVRKINKNCCFEKWADIQASKIETYLGGLNVVPETYNGYVVMYKSFCGWVVDNDFADKDPVERRKLKMLAEPEKEPRRALTPSEVARLLEVTENAPYRYEATGHDRAVFYLIAVETGIRRERLLELMVGDIDFDSDTISLPASKPKQRKKVLRYLKRERARQLKEYVQGKGREERVFHLSLKTRTAEMIKADLTNTAIVRPDGSVAVPSIAFRDAQGRKADFHALKYTYVTTLAQTGATEQEQKILAGHSTKGNMTYRYTTIDPERLRYIIEQMPDYQWPGKVEENTQAKILQFSCNQHGHERTDMESTGQTTSGKPPKTPIQDNGKGSDCVLPVVNSGDSAPKTQNTEKSCENLVFSDPDLQKIAEAWPKLSAEVRAMIVKLVL